MTRSFLSSFLFLLLLMGARSSHAQCPGILPAFRWTSQGTQVVFEDVTELHGLSSTCTWNFQDGSVAYGSVISHTFPTTGTDTVQLDLWVQGCVFSVRGPIPHGDGDDECTMPITPSFTTDQTANNALAFVNTSQSPGMFMYSGWDFGDGTVSLATSGTHPFLLPGLYAVTMALAGTDPNTLDGCVAGLCQTIPVAGNASTCDTLLFVNASVTDVGGSYYSFYGTATTLGSGLVINGTAWDPGDGTPAVSGTNAFTYSYFYPGTYLACFDVEAEITLDGTACWALACAVVPTVQLVGLGPDPTAGSVVSIFPNPILGDRTELSCPNCAAGWTWRLLDVTGRPLGSGGQAFTDRVTVYLPGLSDGIYLLEVLHGEERTSLRLKR
ncbi:MAG: PKD domain-containing protein [Flavobacteriales bacterium]|nr:PKD domain-containing protein [Flavobacteriales bacterium]